MHYIVHMTGIHEETKGRSTLGHVRHVLITMAGEGAPGMVFASAPVAAKCCGHVTAMLVNRYGKTRCLRCDSELAVTK
jgi:hypothetical protein